MKNWMCTCVCVRTTCSIHVMGLKNTIIITMYVPMHHVYVSWNGNIANNANHILYEIFIFALIKCETFNEMERK